MTTSTVFWALIIFVNIFGTLGYAEEEFWSSVLKLTVVIIFIIIGIVLNCGGVSQRRTTDLAMGNVLILIFVGPG